MPLSDEHLAERKTGRMAIAAPARLPSSKGEGQMEVVKLLGVGKGALRERKNANAPSLRRRKRRP